MSLAERRAELRGATYRGDGLGAVAVLDSGVWPREVLQMVGDAVLVALGSGAAGADGVAHRSVTELHRRGWDGDVELADALTAALGGPSTALVSAPVDLEELSMVLEGDPAQGGGRIDLRTGQIWPTAYDDDDEEDDEEEEDDSRWLWVHCEGSRPGYRDMERFIDTLTDPGLAELLTVAISGRGAFRRFKDVLWSRPEGAERWHAYSEDRSRGRARAWLAGQGFTPAVPPSRDGDASVT